MSSTHYRLPRLVIPQSYAVDLNASPKRSTFSGELVLNAKVIDSTDCIELNARELHVSDVTAVVGKTKLKGRVQIHAERESVELIFARPLPRGKVAVHLSFSGKLNPGMHGLYLAKDGNERAIVSQCEATDARAIFPCFDEPDLKATLQWTIRTEADYEVITNGVLDKVSKTRGKPALVVHKFKPTRVISTYLAAVAIGKFQGSKAVRISGIPSRIWGGEGKLKQTGFALDVTRQVLPWYQEYFGQKYNYQKLDQVAVPGFDAGAMENVGAIFYRQNLLLMQPGTTSWQAQKRIAEVIAHEIAHQWFGNLVTMKWWDDLWLNEAFATWIAYKACDEWQPKWRIWDDYLESQQQALAADSLVNTHPVYTEVSSPAEATELFDVITYEKGCAVLRMAENYLGADVFRDGIRRYQEAFKNSNATGADLWNKLSEASQQPVDTLMKSWVTQSGFPLLTVTMGQGNGRFVLHVSQRRFFANSAQMQQEHDQRWMIPLVIRYDMGNGPQTFRVLLTEKEETIVLPEEGHPLWVHPNADATGFYRVQFDETLLRGIVTHGLPHLTPAARMSLLEDTWALVRCGLANVEQFMDVLNAYRHERDHIVVKAMAHRVAYIDQHLIGDGQREGFSQFVRNLFGPQLEELGWDREAEETPERAVRRAAIIDVLGTVGRDDAVLRQAQEHADREMHEPASVEPNLAGVVVSLGALRGGMNRLESYVMTYLARKKAKLSPELQARYLSAMTYFEKKDVISRVHQMCLDDTVPQEQLRTIIGPMLARRASARLTWNFLKEHWSVLGPRIGGMGIARLVEATGGLPVDLRADVLQFFTAHPVEEAKRALQKALEAMDLRRELIERETERLADWLRASAA